MDEGIGTCHMSNLMLQTSTRETTGGMSSGYLPDMMETYENVSNMVAHESYVHGDMPSNGNYHFGVAYGLGNNSGMYKLDGCY